MALLTVTSSEPLRKFVLPVPTTPGYRNLESLVLKTGLFPLEDTACVPLNCKLLLPPGHFRLLVPRGQQARRCVSVLGHQEEGGLPLHSRRQRDTFASHGPLGCPFVLLVSFDGKWTSAQPWPGKYVVPRG